MQIMRCFASPAFHHEQGTHALAEARSELAGMEATIQEASTTLRSYLADLDSQPGRLEEVEERLATYDRLTRRYGPTVAEVMMLGITRRSVSTPAAGAMRGMSCAGMSW